MIKSIVTFLLLTATFTVFSQKASFFADTIYMDKDWRSNPYEGFMKWTIQGKSFGWGETIEVDVTKNQMDTVFFQRSPKSDVDTIICDIKEARNYKFFFNACCGAFNVRSNDSRKISGEVVFELKEKVLDSTVVGTIAETGSFVKGKESQTFSTICSSAMASNISVVSLGEITNCNEIEDCQGWFCNYTENEDEESYSDDLGFKKIYFNFL